MHLSNGVHLRTTHTDMHAPEEGDAVQRHANGVWVVGERDEAVDAVRERRRLRLCDVVEVLTHNLFDGVK